mmetsp:Transcript_96387/g.201378  ORF Transcript_96387/g.201378 Transcript_96387/m.201378 type:complete len:517 (-) Transcript_96387:88-1638(-)
MASVPSWAFYVLYILVFLDTFQLSFVWPLVSTIVQEFDKGATEVGLVTSVAALGEGIFSPVLGIIADRYGRKWVFLVAMVGCSAANILTGLSQSYLMLLLSRLLVGILGGTPPVAAAYITDVTTDEERPTYMTRYQAAYFGGMIGGPVVGGFLNDWWGWRWACIIAGILCALNSISLHFLPESVGRQATPKVEDQASASSPNSVIEASPNPADNAINEDHEAPAKAKCTCALPSFSDIVKELELGDMVGLLKSPNVWIIGIAVFIANCTYTTIETLGTIYLQDRYFEETPDDATLFWTTSISVAAVCGLVNNLFIYEHMVNWISFRVTVILGSVFAIAGLALLTLDLHQYFFLGDVVIYTLGETTTATSGFALLSLCVDKSQVGTAMGVLNMFWNIGSIVGPTVSAALYEVVDFRVLFVGAAILRSLGLLCLLWADAHKSTEEHPLKQRFNASMIARSFVSQPGRGLMRPGHFHIGMTRALMNKVEPRAETKTETQPEPGKDVTCVGLGDKQEAVV